MSTMVERVAKADCAGNADGFPLDHGKSLIGCHCRSGRNEPSERLIGVFCSEIDKRGPQRAGCYGDDLTAHLGLFADVLNGFRVFYHYRFVLMRYNRAEKQDENCG